MTAQHVLHESASRTACQSSPLEDRPDPRAILNSIGEVVYDWDIASDIVRWGANICDVLGLLNARAVSTGQALAKLLAPESPGTRYEAVMAAARQDTGAGASFQVQYGLIVPGSSLRGDDIGRVWIEDTGRAFTGPDKRPVRAHGIIRIITERAEIERQLAFRTVFDPLTGALNRANLASHITQLFTQCAKTQGSFAVLMVGVKNLEWINSTYGYDIADEILATMAARLRLNLRATDKMGRYAGNKFALVLDACDASQMKAAAKRLVETIDGDAFTTSAGPLPVSIKVGAILAPRHARHTQTLLQNVEDALDRANRHEGMQMAIYEPNRARSDAKTRARKITDDIVSALNERRIVLAYQPIIATETGLPVYQEALMRLRQPDGSLVAPGLILPWAEKAGLITLIDHRVLELALARLAALPHLRLSINVSAATLQDAEWPDRLKAALAVHPGTAERLLIEITETMSVENLSATASTIATVRALGVKVAMDDFGAGHTSFRSLRQLGVDILKIDGAFMQNLARSPDDRFFVRTLVELAQHLGIPTVAEWVEDAETARILTEWGVNYLQGHYFGHAEIADDLANAKAA